MESSDSYAADIDPFAHLYPPIEPDDGGYLDVGGPHRIWWEASGNPAGTPALFVHGGPGGAPKPLHRRFYDPDAYRLIVLHQRGCGRSLPLAETHDNNTAALIGDFETLRDHLGIEKWLITGGSWGSCLGLAYGEHHPERCLGFVFVGTLLNRRCDIDWWWHGTRMLFPDAFETLTMALPTEMRDDPRAGFHTQLMDPDPAIHLPTAKALCLFSAATVSNPPSAEAIAACNDTDSSLPLARLFVHYSFNDFFLEPDEILNELGKIRHLPCSLVAGRYDVTTPLASAWALHRAWPGSTVDIIDGGAHSIRDTSMGTAFRRAIDGTRSPDPPANVHK